MRLIAMEMNSLAQAIFICNESGPNPGVVIVGMMALTNYHL